ncbi:MAG TPA: DAK2 domain-containing protein [Candidatus Limnocylindrales bacterium]|nr:DAK2 domain-containing protein [Candidatus Limnocylindrales bacterium]
MPRAACDGAGLLNALRSAVANLEAHVDEINALNVFPVPDGDTGSNMAATVRAALDEAEKAGADAPAERIAQAVSFGALMGARGNSGVITSQIVAGLAHGLAGKRRFNALDLANALDEGTRTAYKAVAKPVEGTILTVIREASAAAVEAAERSNDIEAVLAATVEAAEKAVAKTPSLLPILREAHVVDSGGQGLLRLFEGALASVRGRPIGREAAVRPQAAAPAFRAGVAELEEGAFGYETVFLVTAPPDRELDPAAIQAHLESIGESVLVAGDRRMVKVHVHNERPDEVIAYGLGLGTLTRITIENLDVMADDVREARAAAFVGAEAHAGVAADPVADASGFGRGATHGAIDVPAGEPDVVLTRMPLGVVVVAPSDGLAEVLSDAAAPFREHGAFRVVMGGQAANPSTGELLEAIRATAADELLVLPNNPNVVLAARQVAGMADVPVHVVPTRNVAEGVAALYELEPGRSAAENAAAMTEAGRAVQTLQVTEAVRDATIGGRKVKRGQTIALDPDDGLVAVHNDPHRAVLEAVSRLSPGFSLITIYYGEDATLAEVEVLARAIHDAVSGLEDVAVVHGGQPHYRYLISAE